MTKVRDSPKQDRVELSKMFALLCNWLEGKRKLVVLVSTLSGQIRYKQGQITEICRNCLNDSMIT